MMTMLLTPKPTNSPTCSEMLFHCLPAVSQTLHCLPPPAARWLAVPHQCLPGGGGAGVLTEKEAQDGTVPQGGQPCRAPGDGVAKVPGVGQVGFPQGLVHTISIAGWDQALQPRA